MEHRRIVFGTLLIVIFVLAGCMTTGHKRVQFTFDDVSRLVLGQTMNEDDVWKIFGPAREAVPHYRKPGVWLVLPYGYVVDKGHNRWLWVELQGKTMEDLKLNGFQFISNNIGDMPRLDLEAKDKIKINRSTKTDARSLLGEPSGKITCPTFIDMKLKRCTSGNEIWQYYSPECKENDMVLTQLSVNFNPAGTVVEVKLFEPGVIMGQCMSN